MSIENVKIALSKKYEFIKLLGKGGFAEVYLAKDKLLEREVAIKILLSQHAEDKEVVERFIREAKLYAKFDHENLIPIYETGKIENNAFLVMKYVNGSSLKDIIENDGVLKPDLILKIVKGMASALRYIHNKGIIHRDIKPANILVEIDTDRIFLADFGIARPISSKTLTQTGMLIGTPYYISPEQIKSGTADRRSDIYALGTTLYEVISGSPIFKCETPIEVLYKHVNESPVPIASISPNITMELKHIVEKCLEKNPNDRFQNANEILDIISAGETKKINNNYKKKSFSTTWFFKLSLFLVFITVLSFTLYQYTNILDFLKQKENKNSKKTVNKELINKSNKVLKEDIKEINEIVKEESSKDKTIDIKETEKVEKPGKEKIEVVKTSIEDKKYKEFFDLSKFYYEKSDFISADKYIKRAKKYKETLEFFQLNEKIQNELKKSAKKRKRKKVIKKLPLKKVSLFKLKTELNKSYMLKIDKIRIVISKNIDFFINKVSINGQLTVKIKINEYGKLSLQEINQDNLTIIPVISKRKILRGIWLKLRNIKFLPPVDRKGNKVILENWRVTFIVSKYKNKIILRKV